eukprot:15432860-Alexandrium_andersonii.AAC.1
MQCQAGNICVNHVLHRYRCIPGASSAQVGGTWYCMCPSIVTAHTSAAFAILPSPRLAGILQRPR